MMISSDRLWLEAMLLSMEIEWINITIDRSKMAIKQYPVKHHCTMVEMIKQPLEMYQQVRSSWLVMLLIQMWQQKRVSKLVLIQKWILTKLALIKDKQSSMAYEDSVNKQRKEWSIEGI